jgi:DNA-binding transcriptional regulator YdaS (Cro superfamily)
MNRGKQRNRRTVEEISATPQARAVREAVRQIGGTEATGILVERCSQAVQKWMEFPEKMPPAIARKISRATGYRVPVASLKPDIFGGLTLQELGYVPESYSERP